MTELEVLKEIENVGGIRCLYKTVSSIAQELGTSNKKLSDAISLYNDFVLASHHLEYCQVMPHHRYVREGVDVVYLSPESYSKHNSLAMSLPLVEEIKQFVLNLRKGGQWETVGKQLQPVWNNVWHEDLTPAERNTLEQFAIDVNNNFGKFLPEQEWSANRYDWVKPDPRYVMGGLH